MATMPLRFTTTLTTCELPVLVLMVRYILTFHRAPHSVTEEIWSTDNFNRLVEIKAKYDPQCLLNRGRVPNTQACVALGLANTSV